LTSKIIEHEILRKRTLLWLSLINPWLNSYKNKLLLSRILNIKQSNTFYFLIIFKTEMSIILKKLITKYHLIPFVKSFELLFFTSLSICFRKGREKLVFKLCEFFFKNIYLIFLNKKYICLFNFNDKNKKNYVIYVVGVKSFY